LQQCIKFNGKIRDAALYFPAHQTFSQAHLNSQPLKGSFSQATSSQTAKEYGHLTFYAKGLKVMLECFDKACEQGPRNNLQQVPMDLVKLGSDRFMGRRNLRSCQVS
jgi:hypothetical protein